MDYNVRTCRLFKSGFESFHKLVRQTSDKSYRVNKRHRPAIRKLYSP